MAFVTELAPEDNNIAASATAAVTADRIGNTLRSTFQDNIHKRECSSTQNDYNVKMASRAIGAFVIQHLCFVDTSIAGAAVCDSSEDGGIDAIHVNHNEKTVVVVQAKFNQSGGSTWSKADFLTFKSACEHLQDKQFARFDRILRSIESDILTALDSIDYTFKFVMAHTGKRGAAVEILSDMQRWQHELNAAAIVQSDTPNNALPFQVHLVSAEDIVDWMRVQSSSTIDLEDVELEQYGQIESNYTSYYGMISGEQLAEWWEQHSNNLFTKNIRNLLGKTEVNDSIKTTAINNPGLFWFYNNGITVLVRGIEPFRRNNNRDRAMGRFKFRDVSVINGAQTLSTIGNLASAHPGEVVQIKVHIRFIIIPEGDNDNIIHDITRANNHQNRVLGRDFASQNEQQIRLRDELIIEGYTYKLLRTSSSQIENEQNNIDVDEALNALACLTSTPTTLALLKSQRGKFFDNLQGSQYRSVFNSSVSGIKLINAVRHLRIVDNNIKELLEETNYQTAKKRYGILTHANRVFAAYVLSSTPNLVNARNLLEPDEDRIRTLINRILNLTEQLIERDYPNAYPARFFSNVEKIGLTLSCLRNDALPEPIVTLPEVPLTITNF